MATQNPIESEGTYALPEAQLDRFMLKVLVDYPEPGGRARRHRPGARGPVEVEQALSLEELARCRRASPRLRRPGARRYAQRLAAPRVDLRTVGLGELAPYVEYGVSPRGPINLALGGPRARAAPRPALRRAARHARAAKDVFRHRIVLSYEALADDVDGRRVLDRVLDGGRRCRTRVRRAEVAS
jgi:MoxR-like ATPase